MIYIHEVLKLFLLNKYIQFKLILICYTLFLMVNILLFSL